MDVHVTDVHKGNFAELLPTIQRCITASHFVAIDTELSGIGAHKDLNAPSIEDRFVNISKIARTRAMLSMGLSCFIAQPAPSLSSPSLDDTAVVPLYYTVLVFNIVRILILLPFLSRYSNVTHSNDTHSNVTPRSCSVNRNTL